MEGKTVRTIPTELLGTRVSLRPVENGLGQQILVQATPVGERLAGLLASMDGGGEAELIQVGDRAAYAVVHSPTLDENVKRLVDVLIDLRRMHPTLMQLALDLRDWDPGGNP